MSSFPQDNEHIPSPQMNNNDEYLNDLYQYYQQQEQPYENNDDVYSGCDYQNQYFDEGKLIEEYSYQGGKPLEGNLAQSYEQNTFIYSKNRNTSSQPVSNIHHKKQQPMQIFAKNKSNLYETQHVSNRQQQTNNRSLNALVSASKKRPNKPKKTISQRSASSTSKTFTTKNKIIRTQKEKKQNGDNSIEPLFLNPLTSLPTETMNIEAFLKFYKIDYENLLAVNHIFIKQQKIEQIYKKLFLLGQKSFFKDKNNQAQINDIFNLIGIKNSTKLGKGRALRELKALYKYMGIVNPQNSQQKLKNIGKSANKLQPSYLTQFKLMLGYFQPEEQKFQSGKKGLERYGFQKLERKR